MGQFKDFRKAAFAVGLGLYLGKHVGQYVGAFIDGAAIELLTPVRDKLKAKVEETKTEDQNESSDN